MNTPQNTIAIIYDYDQTLSPIYMQDDVVFPEFGINPSKFWKQCDQLVKEEGYESELSYLKVLLDYLEMDRPSNKKLSDLGENLNFFPGVLDMFDELNSILKHEHKEAGIKIEHYIISSGIQQIIEGSKLKPFIKKIFGCEFAEDKNGKINFPKRIISHTGKTQYLFRINKGALNHHENVNDHVPDEFRPIPFTNMIYIGDGPTDVPCFTVMKQYGGYSIAVYNPKDQTHTSFRKAFQLSKVNDRINYIAPANYLKESHLRLILEEMIIEIASKILTSYKKNLEDSTISAPNHG